jgi:ankyrin repeat protein
LLIAPDNNGNTPLHLACSLCRHRVVEAIAPLYESNIDIKNNQGKTPLKLLAESNSLRLMQVLLDNGAKRSQFADDQHRHTLLHHAAMDHNLPLARVLLRVTTLQNQLPPPSVKWIDGSNADEVSEALAIAATPLKQHSYDNLPIGSAVLDEKDKRSILELLNVADSDGNSALHMAVGMADNDLAMLLLSSNANPLMRNNVGETPYEIAKIQNMESFIARVDDGMTHIHTHTHSLSLSVSVCLCLCLLVCVHHNV